ncbi:MAG TPA: DUF4129 domain-containing protein [Hyphomicrobiales bacterium]|nr:DUF4129 domain-containing protein [Hyphomicrobiales bacterium]
MTAAADAKPALALACALGLVLAFAGTMPANDVAIDGRIGLSLPEWLLPAVVAALTAAAALLFAFVFPWRRRRRKKDEEEPEREEEPPRATLVTKLLLALLLLVPLGLVAGAFYVARTPTAPVPATMRSVARPAAVPPTAARPPAPAAARSAAATIILEGIAVVVAAGALGFGLWLHLADRVGRAPFEPRTPEAEVAAAVEDSLDDLAAEPDARRAIIRCYGHFERALAAADVARRPAETALEYMREALGRLTLPEAAVRELTRLFELSRFSRHPLGRRDRDLAMDALVAIRGALDRRADAHG